MVQNIYLNNIKSFVACLVQHFLKMLNHTTHYFHTYIHTLRPHIMAFLPEQLTILLIMIEITRVCC